MRIDSITATLGDTPLPLISGTITLDATRVPYAQGTLTTPLPNTAVLDALNPMDAPRVTVTTSVAGTDRMFSLRLQARSLDTASDIATLTIESDEGALMNLVLVPEVTLTPLVADPLTAVAHVQAQVDALNMATTKDRSRNALANAVLTSALDDLVPEVAKHSEALQPQRLAATVSKVTELSAFRNAG
ncbi:hypothetical protein GCM10027414_07190 [Humibacter ginsengiterrae]